MMFVNKWTLHLSAQEFQFANIPEAKSSAAFLLTSTSYFTLRSIRIKSLPFLMSKKREAVQNTPMSDNLLKRRIHDAENARNCAEYLS